MRDLASLAHTAEVLEEWGTTEATDDAVTSRPEDKGEHPEGDHHCQCDIVVEGITGE